MSKKVEIDEQALAGVHCALIAFKFKLCEPPKHDGRNDVYLALVARRDAQLECVKEMLNTVGQLTKTKPSKKIIKAFS